MPLVSADRADKIGFLLTRVIVPLWIAAGVVLKLKAATPKLLPEELWTTAVGLGINLLQLLAVLIALEIFAISVMVFLPRVARYMAIWMMGCFCLILLNEIRVGHTACGCLGSFSPSPWVMLSIDASLLLGVLFFRQRLEGEWFPKPRLLAAGGLTAVGVALCAVLILGENVETIVPAPPAVVGQADGGTPADGGTTGTTEPAGMVLPPYVTIQPDDWVGQPFVETELAKFVSGWSPEVTEGLHHVIFFSRSCDHCQLLLENHFFENPPIPTTLVAIPETKAGFDEATQLDMAYCQDCVGHLELPVGSDWIVTPPVVVSVESGIVACAKEADDPDAPECLLWR
jgi:hypothetical protein